MPPKPKSRRSVILHARTAWIYFGQSRESALTNMTLPQRSSYLSNEWQRMSAEEKAPFEQMARNDKERYERQQAQLSKAELKLLREHRRAKKKAQKNRPKAPKSPYMLFCQRERPEVLRDLPGISFAEIGRELGRRWKCLSETDRIPFKEQHQLAKVAYKAAIDTYHDMVKSKRKREASPKKTVVMPVKKKKKAKAIPPSSTWEDSSTKIPPPLPS